MMQQKVSVAALEGGIYHVGVPWGNNASQVYVVDGEKAALIEPGPAIVGPYILEGLRQLGYDTSRISYIIPTHIHVDHGGAAGYLSRQWPWAKVVVHPRAASHLINPERLIASTRFTFGDSFEEQFGPILPVPESQVQVARDGESIALGGRSLQVLHTPGHAPHHLAIYDARMGDLFCGEALGLPIDGLDFILPSAAPPSFDVDLYLNSMERLRALRPSALYYSHAGISKKVDQAVDRVRQSTLACLDVVKRALKDGCGREETLRLFGQFLVKQGADPMYNFPVILAGFMSYLERKGVS